MVVPIGGSNKYPEVNPDIQFSSVVVEACAPILDSLDKNAQFDAISRLYAESKLGPDTSTPWTMIFDDVDHREVASRLLATLLAPDELPLPKHDRVRNIINDVNSALGGANIERGPATTAAAGLLLQRAVEKPDVPFRMYADQARELPLRHGWSDRLIQQFGMSACRNIMTAQPRLEFVTKQTEDITAAYYEPSELEYQQHPDRLSTLVYGFLPADERYALYLGSVRRLRELPTVDDWVNAQ